MSLTSDCVVCHNAQSSSFMQVRFHVCFQGAHLYAILSRDQRHAHANAQMVEVYGRLPKNAGAPLTVEPQVSYNSFENLTTSICVLVYLAPTYRALVFRTRAYNCLLTCHSIIVSKVGESLIVRSFLKHAHRVFSLLR